MPVRAPFAVLFPENKSSRPCLQPGCRSDQRRTLRSLSWVSSLSFLQRFFDLMAGPGSANGGEASEGIGSADACPLLEVCRPLAWPSACACWGGPPPGPSLVNLRRGAAFAQTLEPLQGRDNNPHPSSHSVSVHQALSDAHCQQGQGPSPTDPVCSLNTCIPLHC